MNETVNRNVPSSSAAEQKIRGLVERLELAHEVNRASINLVPSENRISPLVERSMRLDFYNRYFFNDDLAAEGWWYRGGESVGDIQSRTGTAALARLAGAEHVNVRPVSGMTAMLVVLLGLGGPAGSAVVSVEAVSGGHYATAALIERIGRKSRAVGQHAGHIDTDALRKVLTGEDVPLVYLDLQNTLHELDVRQVVDVVREYSPGTRVHVDCSHTLGLILGGAHANPLDAGADSMGGSTHKSFPGPQKGVLFTRDAQVAEDLRGAQYHSISSHHFAATLGLSVAAAEYEVFGQAYAAQVLRNAEALGTALERLGFEPIKERSVITRTHQLWLSIGTDEQVTEFSATLALAGIRANLLPDIPGATGLAMRLGVNEITFEGADDQSMAELADIFALVRDGHIDQAVKMRVDLRRGFGEPYYFQDASEPR
jgi:glycine/serine hydroxymethyltransferase